MVERHARRTRRRRLAFGAALFVALAGAAFLVLSVQEHHHARDDLARARRELATARATTSREALTLADEKDVVDSVHEGLASIATGATPVADLDQRDLDAVRAAVQAGLAGDAAAYNAAVDQREASDHEHDAAVEQLRQQANVVLTALAALS